jgi:hypothetical protein
MYGLYAPILLLQAFCVYHAYKNGAEQRWYWFILLFPIIGCAMYVYHHFYNRQTIELLSENVKGVFNTNYRIEQLEKAVRFSDTIKNRLTLAEAYVEIGRYPEAHQLYQECLQGFMADDPDLKMKLLHTSYLVQDFSLAVMLGASLGPEKSFRNSEARLAYAWSLHALKRTEEAEQVFQDMDKPFTNYRHRLEYSRVLQQLGRKQEVKAKLAGLLEEFDHMRGPERKIHKDIIRQTEALYSELENTKQNP